MTRSCVKELLYWLSSDDQMLTGIFLSSLNSTSDGQMEDGVWFVSVGSSISTVQRLRKLQPPEPSMLVLYLSEVKRRIRNDKQLRLKPNGFNCFVFRS